MKRKISLIISILLMVIFLSGCGIFVMPDDSEFITVVDECNTPQKICDYMADNFKYKYNGVLITPYQLYISRKGNCDDFAYFGRYIVHQYGYETYWIRIFYTTGTTTHIIGIYIEDGKYNYSSNVNYYPIQADTFKDCVLDYFLYSDKELLKYDVYDYCNNVIK